MNNTKEIKIVEEQNGVKAEQNINKLNNNQNIIFNTMKKMLNECEKNKQNCLCIMNVYREDNIPKFSGLCVEKEQQQDIYNLFRNNLQKLNNDIEY